MTETTLIPHPAESSASGCGSARGTAPGLPRTVARLAGDLELDPEVLRYAQSRAFLIIGRFSGVQSIDVLLSSPAAGETTCRLHITFMAAPAIRVGHSGPAVLHAIDTAVETAAHIVATQTRKGS